MHNQTERLAMMSAITAIVTNDGRTNQDLKAEIETLMPLVNEVTPAQQNDEYGDAYAIWAKEPQSGTDDRIRRLLGTTKNQHVKAIRLSLLLDNKLMPPPYVPLLLEVSNLAEPADALFWAQEHRDVNLSRLKRSSFSKLKTL
jgi:hypothetical protein